MLSKGEADVLVEPASSIQAFANNLNNPTTKRHVTC